MNRITLAFAAALAALVAAAPVAARPTATASTVRVTMKEFKFILTKSTVPHSVVTSVPHGVVTFKLVNKGKLSHDFRIAGKTSKLIKPGKSGTFTVTLKKKGKYVYNCPIPGHTAAGMKGTLKVT
jgi:uncharacterized cupredoxin-like copper-binding protein